MSKVRRVDYSPDEFLLGVTGMSAIDIAVYWVACSLMYSTGGGIPIEDERLFAIIKARAPDIRKSLLRLTSPAGPGLDAKLMRNGDVIDNKRTRNELQSASKRIRNGVEAANKRWGNDTESEQIQYDKNAVALSPVKPSLTINHQPPTTNKKERAPKGASYSPDFEAWYSGYPHKIGKDAAAKAFVKVMARGDVTIAQLMGGVQGYIKTKGADTPWCNPATWLNQGRWQDQPQQQLELKPQELKYELPEGTPKWKRRMFTYMPQTHYRSYIEPLEQAIDVEKKTITVTAPTKFICDYVTNHHRQGIADAFGVELKSIKIITKGDQP